ncbi:Atrochrysone carboxyl ACP thioesterase dmxR1 [Xanthoria parietina]
MVAKGGEGGYRQINKNFNACAFDDYLSSQTRCLPSLPNTERISPRVIRVLGGNPGKFTLQGTNTYIVGTGSQRILVDSAQGFDFWTEAIRDLLTEENITISHVLLTHWHGDHTGGVPGLLKLYPDLSTGIYKNSPDEGQQEIEDGQIISVEGATIKAVHTPGHSHDHMSFILQEESAMFTGDNVLGHGTSAVEVLGEYMDSLRLMRDQNCERGYPAHGAVIPNLGAKIQQDLGQKERRERQILKSLKSIKESERRSGNPGAKGSTTVKDLVVSVHGEGMDAEVSNKVLEPFTGEVLGKLAGDGKVGFELSGGAKKWFINEVTAR